MIQISHLFTPRRWSGESAGVWVRCLHVRVDAPQAWHERRGRLDRCASVTKETGKEDEEMTELDWTGGGILNGVDARQWYWDKLKQDSGISGSFSMEHYVNTCHSNPRSSPAKAEVSSMHPPHTPIQLINLLIKLSHVASLSRVQSKLFIT